MIAPLNIDITMGKMVCNCKHADCMKFPFRTALDSVLLQLFRLCKVVPKQVFVYKNVRLTILSVLWFAASLTLALFVSKISYIISVTGGLAATFIFIFPG